MIIRVLITVFLSFFFFTCSFAQEKYTIHWIEKAKNSSFFERGKELPILLVEAVKSKKIIAYELPQNQALLQEMTAQHFLENMKIPQKKGILITEETEEISLPENAQWLPQDISVFAVYEDVTDSGKIEYLAIYVPNNDKNIFIAAFKFKEVEKLFKKSADALWQSPTQANFGNVLHLDIDDGSAYKVAKSLIMNEKENKISSEFKEKIADESLSYEWLVRPNEKKISKKEFQPTEIEVYNENIELKLVAKFDFEKVKTSITEKDVYFLSYAEALKQKLFVSNLQKVMPTPQRKEKAKSRFKKQVISDLNMKEEENKVLFQQGNELVKYLVEAVQKRKITAYWTDSLESKMPVQDFEFRISLSQSSDEADSAIVPSKKLEIRQLYKLNLVEEMSFDQWGRRKNYQIKAIAFLLPAQENAKGIDEAVAYFSYKDMNKLLKKNKLKEMLSFFENRDFKAIPIFMKPARRE